MIGVSSLQNKLTTLKTKMFIQYLIMNMMNSKTIHFEKLSYIKFVK